MTREEKAMAAFAAKTLDLELAVIVRQGMMRTGAGVSAVALRTGIKESRVRQIITGTAAGVTLDTAADVAGCVGAHLHIYLSMLPPPKPKSAEPTK